MAWRIHRGWPLLVHSTMIVTWLFDSFSWIRMSGPFVLGNVILKRLANGTSSKHSLNACSALFCSVSSFTDFTIFTNW